MGPRGKSVTLSIDIVGDASRSRGAFRETRGEVQGLGADAQRLAADLGLAVATYRGFGELKGAAEAASSLNEMRATTEQVFQGASAEVLAFGANAAQGFGQAEQASLLAMNAYGGILNNMGLLREESARWSTDLAARASDLAAAWDTEVPDALQAIQSGLSGQTEPLRRYGIDITQASLAQDALALGIDKSVTAMSREERARVILHSIMRQSADAEGQFAREKEGLNQQMAIQAAEAENARAALGQGLLPVFTMLAKATSTLLSGFSALPSWMQTATAGAGLLAVGLAAVGLAATRGWPMIRAGAAAFADLTRHSLAAGAAARTAGGNILFGSAAAQQGAAANGRYATSMRSLGSAARIGAGGLTILTAGFGVWMAQQAEAQARAEAWNAEMRTMAEEAERTGDSIEDVFRRRVLLDFATNGAENLARLGISLSELDEAVYGSDEAWQQFIDNVEARNRSGIIDAGTNIQIRILEDLRDQLVDTRQHSEDYEAAKKDLGVAEEEAADSTDRHTGALDRQTSALQRAQEAIERRYDRVREQFDLERSLEDATRSTAEAEADLALARSEATQTSEQYRQATEAVADAHRGVADAVRGTREAEQGLADAHRGVTEAQAKLNDERAEAKKRIDEMREAARDARLEEERADLTARQAARALLASSADPRLTDLEREDMALKAKEAQEAARDATRERAEAEADQAEAARRGVDGDERVIDAQKQVADAKRAVADASDRVSEAERRVEEAQRRVAEASRQQANTMTEAKSRVEEAERRVEDAMLDEAQAAADLAGAQLGAAGSVQAHIDKLDILTARLDPNSPLRQRLEALRDELMWNATEGGRVMSGQQSLAVAERAAAAVPNVTVNQTVQGTPRAQRQAVRESFSDLVNDFWRRTG